MCLSPSLGFLATKCLPVGKCTNRKLRVCVPHISYYSKGKRCLTVPRDPTRLSASWRLSPHDNDCCNRKEKEKCRNTLLRTKTKYPNTHASLTLPWMVQCNTFVDNICEASHLFVCNNPLQPTFRKIGNATFFHKLPFQCQA